MRTRRQRQVEGDATGPGVATVDFDRIAELSASVAARPEPERAILGFLSTPPGELYEALSAGSVAKLTELSLAVE